MALNDAVPSKAFDVLEANMLVNDEFTNGTNETVNNRPAPNGHSVTKTLYGMNEEFNRVIATLGYAIVGDFADVTKATITNNSQVYTSKSVVGFEGYVWRTNQILPYTPTGSDPTQAPELGKWLAVAIGELQTIARSLNVLDSDVIYATDTVTPIPAYIYSASQQKTYSVPANANGKIISTVILDQLTTTEPATYTLETIERSALIMTLTEAVASTNVSLGDSVRITDRSDGLFDFVEASTVTTNTFDVIQCVGKPDLALVYRASSPVDVRAIGATGDLFLSNGTVNPSPTDDYLALQHAIDTYPITNWQKDKAFSGYYIGDNTLLVDDFTTMLGSLGSASESSKGPTGTTISALKKPTTPFGDQCVVKCREQTQAGLDFIYEPKIKGFILDWFGYVNRDAVKGDGSICYNANNSLKGEIDIICRGGEYGMFSYSAWGYTGRLKIWSCHKGYYADPVSDPASSKGGTTTTNRLRFESDFCPFPIYAKNINTSQFFGWAEACLSTYPIYDAVNETACLVSGENIDACQFIFDSEVFEGSYVNVTTGCRFDFELWTPNGSDDYLKNPNGIDQQGADYNYQTEIGGTPTITTASTLSSYYTHGSDNQIQVKNPSLFGSNAPEDGYDRAWFNATGTSSFLLIGGYVNEITRAGGDILITRSGYSKIDFINTRNIEDAYIPNSDYRYVGRGCIETIDRINSTPDGSMVAEFTIPTGWSIKEVTANTIVSGVGQDSSIGILTTSATSWKFQSNVSSLFAVSGYIKAKIIK